MHKGAMQRLRFEVLKRDNFTCQYCGRHAPNVELEVDHVIPQSQGGENTKENLVTACTDCNQGKSSLRLDEEFVPVPKVIYRASESFEEVLAAIPFGTMTEDEILAARTPAGSWTAATLNGWGVPWPPPRGWKARLMGKAEGST